jgi:hypothetical protein
VAVPADSTSVVAVDSNLAVEEDSIRLVGIVVAGMGCRSNRLLGCSAGRYCSKPVEAVAGRMAEDPMVRPLKMLVELFTYDIGTEGTYVFRHLDYVLGRGVAGSLACDLEAEVKVRSVGFRTTNAVLLSGSADNRRGRW